MSKFNRMRWTSWYKTKTCRMASMLCLTFSFFLTEIVFGYVTNSLALVGDSYHMLSDVMALAVGLTSVRMSKRASARNTYGWARAEVMGALVNSVFLVALCFTIFVEAIQRLTHPHIIEHVDSMIYVGVAGLVVNVLGLVLFYDQAQGKSVERSDLQEQTHENSAVPVSNHVDGSSTSAGNTTTVIYLDDDSTMESIDVSNDSIATNQAHIPDNPSTDSDAKKRKTIKSGAQLNMRAVFLHVLGDALGSVVVIISALLIKFIVHDWKYYIDPVLSMVLVCIIMSTTIPLLKESSLILMQTVPAHIDALKLKNKILETVRGVCNVHEFHVWQLSGNRIIATAHVRCCSLFDYARIAGQIKSLLHDEGIHSTTVQPEFVEVHELAADRLCALECGPDKPCYADTCCARLRTDDDQQNSTASQQQDFTTTDPSDGGRFTDVIGTFIAGGKQPKRQPWKLEFRPNGVVGRIEPSESTC